MAKDSATNVLRDNKLLKGVGPEDVALLGAAGEFITVGKEELIIREGETNAYMYLICSGVCEVSLGNAPEHLVGLRIATHGPAGFFGEYSFLDRNLACASVRAVSDAELFRLPFTTLDTLLEENLNLRSAIYRNMLDVMVVRLRESVAELGLFGDTDCEDLELTSS